MKLFDMLIEGYKKIIKIIWVALIPIGMDLVSYLLYINTFNLPYNGIDKSFVLKLGIIQAPPTAKFILEDFPTVLYSYNSDYGMTGIVSELTVFNCFLLLTIVLIHAFLTSGYMGCLERAGIERVTPISFFSLGNKNWFKYFILNLVYCISFLLCFIGIIPKGLLLFLFFIIFMEYAIVVDDLPINESFSKALRIFVNNIILVIRMGICYGLVFSLASIILLPLSRSGTIGIITVISAVNILGIGVNKAVLEVYRKISFEDSNGNDDPIISG
ncbi:hypothetical protein [Wukongibacter baidiensis]